MPHYHIAFYLPHLPGEMVVAEALDFPGAMTQGFDLAAARLMIASALEAIAPRPRNSLELAHIDMIPKGWPPALRPTTTRGCPAAHVGVGDVPPAVGIGFAPPAGTAVASLPEPLLPSSVTAGGVPAFVQCGHDRRKINRLCQQPR
jgi:hypothetical protein